MKNESRQIQELKYRYKLSLDDKANMIDDYFRNVVESKSLDSHMLEELNGFLHKLAGSSGMYGYEDIASLSRESMNSIQECRKEDVEKNLVNLRNLLKDYA